MLISDEYASIRVLTIFVFWRHKYHQNAEFIIFAYLQQNCRCRWLLVGHIEILQCAQQIRKCIRVKASAKYFT